MFTGIIEEVGTVTSIQKMKDSMKLWIQGNKIFEGLKVGDSIAVNGLCLTVCEFNKTVFRADVMGESLNRSGIGRLNIGSKVNLERAMMISDRFGGHIVTGHIDGIGRIAKIKEKENAIEITVKTEPKIIRYCVEKGSITLDGISLTIGKVNADGFIISIIPHTKKCTTLMEKNTGDFLNIENDLIGKYIEKLMINSGGVEETNKKVTLDFLEENGF
jgi:riboflavin synthase